MTLEADSVVETVIACCVLHNLLRIRNPSATEGDSECPDTHAILPGDWRQDQTLSGITTSGISRQTILAKRQQEYLKDYFMSPVGSVSWQEQMI